MKGLHLAVLIALIGIVACAPQGSQTSTEIPALSDRWEQALNAGDIDTLVSLYAEDCRLLPPNAELAVGQDAVRAAFGGMIDAGLKGQLETIQAVVAGDVGYHVGSYAIESEGAVVERGKFIEIWRKVGGEWKISSDIWNSNTMGPPAGVTTMVFTHEVEDGSHWIAAFQRPDSRADQFAEHGVIHTRVFQSADDPNLTGLVIDMADPDAFLAFLQTPEADEAKAADGVKDATLKVFAEVK